MYHRFNLKSYFIWLFCADTTASIWHQKLILDQVLAIISQHPEFYQTMGLLTQLVWSILIWAWSARGPGISAQKDCDALIVWVGWVLLINKLQLTYEEFEQLERIKPHTVFLIFQPCILYLPFKFWAILGVITFTVCLHLVLEEKRNEGSDEDDPSNDMISNNVCNDTILMLLTVTHGSMVVTDQSSGGGMFVCHKKCDSSH